MLAKYKQFFWIAAVILVLAAGWSYLNQRESRRQDQQKPGIVILEPKDNSLVDFPLTVKGQVTGQDGWAVFEGHAGTVQIFDSHGPISEIQALLVSGDWMALPADFTALLGDGSSVNKIKDDTGYFLFKNENPSGEAARDREFRLIVRFDK